MIRSRFTLTPNCFNCAWWKWGSRETYCTNEDVKRTFEVPTKLLSSDLAWDACMGKYWVELEDDE